MSAVDRSIAIRIIRLNDLDDTPGPAVTRILPTAHTIAPFGGQVAFSDDAPKPRLRRIGKNGAKDHAVTIDGPKHCPTGQIPSVKDHHLPSERGDQRGDRSPRLRVGNKPGVARRLEICVKIQKCLQWRAVDHAMSPAAPVAPEAW
jgi:hypothetical protein